jgi:hypothetical protein
VEPGVPGARFVRAGVEPSGGKVIAVSPVEP